MVHDFESILECCQRDLGDERAWGHMMKRFDGSILIWARSYLRRGGVASQLDEDALEIRMEVWLRLLRDEGHGIRSFAGTDEEAFRAYLARMARNAVLDLQRRRHAKKRPQIADLDDDARSHVIETFRDEELDPAETLVLIDMRDQCFATLTEHWSGRKNTPVHRNLLVCQLAWLHGQSANRIAGIRSLELSRGGVEKVVDKARRHVREALGPEVFDA